MMINNIQKPKYYNVGSIECIEVMRATQGNQAVFDFCVCNALKYIFRWKNKNGIEDLKKSKMVY